MEKTLNIDGKEVRFKSTAGTLMRYRMNFGRDLIKDIAKLEKRYKSVENGEDEFEIYDLEMFEKIAWSMAKTANNDIADIENWLDEFESFSIMVILPEIMDLLIANMKQEQESKKKFNEGGQSKEITGRLVILRGLELGLTLKDMDNVTIGFICELIEEHNSNENDEVIEATEEMLERF